MTEPLGSLRNVGPIHHDVGLHPWITTHAHRVIAHIPVGAAFDWLLIRLICKRPPRR